MTISCIEAYPAEFFWGGIAATAILLISAAVIAIRGEQEAERFGEKRRMVPLIGMVFFGAAFLGCAAWYFWPAPSSTTVHENTLGASHGKEEKRESALGYSVSFRIKENEGASGGSGANGDPVKPLGYPDLPFPEAPLIGIVLFFLGGWLSGRGMEQGKIYSHIGGWLVAVSGGTILLLWALPYMAGIMPPPTP